MVVLLNEAVGSMTDSVFPLLPLQSDKYRLGLFISVLCWFPTRRSIRCRLGIVLIKLIPFKENVYNIFKKLDSFIMDVNVSKKAIEAFRRLQQSTFI